MSRVLLAAVALALVGLLGAGCTSDRRPPSWDSNVDRSNPDAVIATALETMFTWKPAEEQSSSVAYKRAGIYLSNELASQGDDVPPPGDDSQWSQWRAEGVSVAAKAYFVADETPPDSDSEIHRVVVVIQSATTQDNRLVDEIRHTVWVTAKKYDDGWLVTSIKF